MKYLQSLVIFLSVFLLQGCFIGADGDTEKVIGSYYISGDYELKNVHLGFEDKEWCGIGLIKQPIIEIGHNDQYIIIKREKDKLEYFIVKITNSGIHSEAEKNIFGPMTEFEFNKSINKLNLQNIKWTKKFKK